MGELLAEVGDLVFSLVIGYLGALEFYYVVRHLYHWTFQHPEDNINDAEGLKRLQDGMRDQLAKAEAKEKAAGANAMQDGVLYKDGFRIDPQQQEIDKLKVEKKFKEEQEKRHKEMEAELARQKRIEEETRQQLARAEAELERQRKEEEERNANALLMAERAREEQQRQLELAQQERDENERKLIAAEKEREEKQKQQEEHDKAEAVQSIAAEQQRLEEARNARLAQFEVEREKEQRQLELQQEQEEEEAERSENEKRLIEAEKLQEMEQKSMEEQREATLAAQMIFTGELERESLQKQQEVSEEHEEAAEQTRKLLEAEREKERKQRLKEENARLFLEAEQEMVALQQSMEEAVQKRHVPLNTQVSIVEEPCIKKEFKPLTKSESPTQTVKTQLRQTGNTPYIQSSKSLLFPGVSDDGSSVEPGSSAHSSLTTLASEDNAVGQMLDGLEREAPDGEDNAPAIQYTDDYLRSLDGIKQRPLMREDGSGRRRAFKKRRSSGSSNSSRESRTSREEEIKMFTSLEEEEMHEGKKGEDEFTAIKYSSEPTLKVKGHHRRHKRSPAKDAKTSDESLRSSLERLNEENTNPWGEVVPEHYKNTAFWKREKAMSIDEEDNELGQAATKQLEEATEREAASHIPKTSSFEEATEQQNEEALTALQKQLAKDKEEQQEHRDITDEPLSEKHSNLQTSQNTVRGASPARSSSSPRLRRSPRIDELDQYEEHENKTVGTEESKIQLKAAIGSPSISVSSPPDTAPWRDEHGLMMQGLSDFYDFTASMNPSRSRDNSRATTPVSSKPNIQYPKNICYKGTLEERADGVTMDFIENQEQPSGVAQKIEVYDDTANAYEHVVEKSDIIEFFEDLNEAQVELDICHDSASNNLLNKKLKYVADDPNRHAPSLEMQQKVIPFVLEDAAGNNTNTSNDINLSDNTTSMVSMRLSSNLQEQASNFRTNTQAFDEFELKSNSDQESYIESTTAESSKDEMNSLLESLRVQRCRSTSRSRSPLPTADNIQRSLETRRNKRIEQNDQYFEKIERTKSPPGSPFRTDIGLKGFEAPTISVECIDDSKSKKSATEKSEAAEMVNLVESLRIARANSRSRSKSPMRIPTEANLTHSIEVRANKQIQQNDELFAQLTENANTPEPQLVVEYDGQILNKNEEEIEYDQSTKNNVELEHTRSRAHSKSGSKSSDRVALPYQAPTIAVDCVDDSNCKQLATENNEASEMSVPVESLRINRANPRSRSKSPMRVPSEANLTQSIETRRNKLINQNDKLLVQLNERSKTPEPQLAVEYVYQILNSNDDEAEHNQRKTTDVPRGRSRSRTPSRSRSKSPMRATLLEEYQFLPSSGKRANFENNDTNTPDTLNNLSDYYDFHQMLNEEAANHKTLAKNTEEQETSLAVRQRLIDEESLHKLRIAQQEIELRTLTPDNQECLERHKADNENNEQVESETSNKNTLRKLKCTPTTPDYDRSISSEWQDVQRIKQEILASGFKRSTYVGESMDLGSEYFDLRREAANFQRSQSRSRSPFTPEQRIVEQAQRNAADTRQIQENILAEITTYIKDEISNADKRGARPKTDYKKSAADLEHSKSISKEWLDTQRIKEEMLKSGFQRSNYAGESLDMSAQYEQQRREAEQFRRSRSKSRSPLDSQEEAVVAAIDAEAAKRELQDQILDEISKTTLNFQDFSRHLNADFLDNDRRASDSALIQKPEILFQLQDNDPDLEMEPEEYHHYRRFSLRQEQQMEEYPSDEDFVFMSQIEVLTPNGTRTWTREDFYSNDFDTMIDWPDNSSSQQISVEVLDREEAGQLHDEEDTDGSEDERRTVVDVDDEIDEDINDFNERGPAEESQHEQSECEEAEREADRFANRSADDWQHVEELDCYADDRSTTREANEDEGAVGGMSSEDRPAYDSDSFAIDEIYDEAIRNRKQSGILRDFDSILNDMQPFSQENSASQSEGDTQDGSVPYRSVRTKISETEHTDEARAVSADVSLNIIESERLDIERDNLADAIQNTRNPTRLRTRYGFAPVLQNNNILDNTVDLDYKPKREYNWRKNFKLDEDVQEEQAQEPEKNENKCDSNVTQAEIDEDIPSECIDIRKFSLGGESITLFSRSPEREQLTEVTEEVVGGTNAEPELDIKTNIDKTTQEAVNVMQEANEKAENSKKKKSKRKSHKESKESIEKHANDEDDSEPQLYSRRSSSIQMETDSPKRKSRSRRSSRSSLFNEDTVELYSPSGCIDQPEPIDGFTGEYTEFITNEKKKSKKRKKAKETIVYAPKIKEEHTINESLAEYIIPEAVLPISAAISPDSAALNVLSTLSSANSVCVTPESESNDEIMQAKIDTASTAAIDTFDILKDGNLYPLF